MIRGVEEFEEVLRNLRTMCGVLLSYYALGNACLLEVLY